MQIRRTAAALTSAAALSITGVAMATPAQSAPVITGGLVNVTLVNTDILSGNVTQVALLNGVTLQVAANVCGVAVGVLAQDLQDGTADCTALNDADTDAIVTQRGAANR